MINRQHLNEALKVADEHKEGDVVYVEYLKTLAAAFRELEHEYILLIIKSGV